MYYLMILNDAGKWVEHTHSEWFGEVLDIAKAIGNETVLRIVSSFGTYDRCVNGTYVFTVKM